ncbi:MAG: hypothetical protein AAFR26_09540 [Cyanobacteria bacterium J06626_4]
MVSYFEFNYSERIKDQHKKSELAQEIAERVSQTIQINKDEDSPTIHREIRFCIFRDERYDSRFYLKDVHNVFRLVEDTDTLLYLFEIFDILEADLQDIPSLTKVASFPRGASVPKVREWKPPITPEEEEKRELEYRISKLIKIEPRKFKRKTEEDYFEFLICNKSEYEISVRSVEFRLDSLHPLLSKSDFSDLNKDQDGNYCLLFNGKNFKGKLTPDIETRLILFMRKKISEKDYEKLMTLNLGYLILNIDYQGKELGITKFDF